jgi:hypothetical protein
VPRKAGLVAEITSKTRELIELCESMRVPKKDEVIPSQKLGLIDLAQQCYEQGALYAVEAAKL